MLRVTAGGLKGLSLAVPKQTRPTEDKVRQALFNILGDSVTDAVVVDGCAGSGALGIEALSRGARHVLFLESHPAAVATIRRNLARVAPGTVPGSWEVCRDDLLRGLERWARQGRRADLIFLDPPYREELATKALRLVAGHAILAPSGLACVEHASSSQCGSSVSSLMLVKQHRYGETVLSFYQAPDSDKPAAAG